MDGKELRTPEFAAIDPMTSMAILPTAATGQPGRRLPVGTAPLNNDSLPAPLKDRCPIDLDLHILPVQSAGKAIEHLGAAGTVTMTAETAAISPIGQKACGWIADDLNPAGVVGDPHPATAEKRRLRAETCVTDGINFLHKVKARGVSTFPAVNPPLPACHPRFPTSETGQQPRSKTTRLPGDLRRHIPRCHSHRFQHRKDRAPNRQPQMGHRTPRHPGQNQILPHPQLHNSPRPLAHPHSRDRRGQDVQRRQPLGALR